MEHIPNVHRYNYRTNQQPNKGTRYTDLTSGMTSGSGGGGVTPTVLTSTTLFLNPVNILLITLPQNIWKYQPRFIFFLREEKNKCSFFFFWKGCGETFFVSLLLFFRGFFGVFGEVVSLGKD